MKSSKIYDVCLMLLAAFSLLGVIVISLFTIPEMAAQGTTLTPQYVVVAVYSVMTFLLIATLVCRAKYPRAGRILSIIVNVLIMYTFFPIGVIVGIYGFRKGNIGAKEQGKVV